jgi:hypothetical protein
MVMIVTFQAQDKDLVMTLQVTLEDEVQNIIANGKEENVLINDIDGIWFRGVQKNRNGKVNASIKHINKRTSHTLPK